MQLVQRLIHDLKAGLLKLRYCSIQTAGRTRKEIEFLRLRFEVQKLAQELEELYGAVGEHVMNLREVGEPIESIRYDFEINQLIENIQKLKSESEQYKFEMMEIRAAG